MSDHDGRLSAVLPGDSAIRRLVYAQAELARTPAGGGPIEGFLVDPEQAQAAIARLDEAILDIRRSLAAFRTTEMAAPARDAVSQNLGRQIAVMDARAAAYIQEWARQLEEFRNAIQDQVDAYERVEDENAERLA